MATDHNEADDLIDGVVGSLVQLKEEPLDIIDCLQNNHTHHTKSDLLPTLADDLLSLCDNYNLYLTNEEIVYTEPLDYDPTAGVDEHILDGDLFGSETDVINENKDFLDNNDYQTVIGESRCTYSQFRNVVLNICIRSFLL